MAKLYRNPVAWLLSLILIGLSFAFFWKYPRLASVFFGAAAVWIFVRRICSASRLRKLGYRIVWHGRDTFYYEELFDGQLRRAEIECELRTRGPRILRFPSSEDWQWKMPEWARGRREEIFERVRSELDTKAVRYIYNESEVT